MKHEAYNTVLNRYKAVVNESQVALKEHPGGGGQVALNENANQYKFNGQELQDELGLNITAMDWRQYDMAIGRFVCVDPVTHFSQSPYNAFDGNPVLIADPSGADGTRGDGNGGTIYTNAYGTSSSPGYNGYSSMGSGWHVGSQLIGGPIDGSSGGLFGNFYNINANHSNLSVFGKTWVPYSITPSSEAGVLDTVNLGYWQKVAGWDIANGVGLYKTGCIKGDGLNIYGIGGDPVAGSGYMKGDRGTGAMDMPGHDYNMLFDFGQLVGSFFSWFTTNRTITPPQPVSSPQPFSVVVPATVTMQLYNYNASNYANNKSFVSGIGRDTTVITTDSAIVNEINKANYNIQKRKAESINRMHQKQLDYYK